LLDALADGDGERMLGEVATLAEFSPDWGSVLDALADGLHRAQVKQLVPAVEIDADGVDIDALAAALRPEVVQLWYQMALNGRRDLPLAPSPRAGFEMSLLRMLAFRPAEAGVQTVATPAAATRIANAGAAKAALASDAAPAPSRPARPAPPVPAASPARVEPPQRIDAQATTAAEPKIAPAPDKPSPDRAASASAEAPAIEVDADRWLDLVAGSGLRGPARELAAHAAFIGYRDGVAAAGGRSPARAWPGEAARRCACRRARWRAADAFRE